MSSPARRLAAVRAIRSARGGRTLAGAAYLVYAVLLTALVIGVSAGRGVGMALSRPPVLEAFRSPEALQVVATVGGLLLVALAALGAVRGPALLPSFLVAAVAGTDLPRRRTLARPFRRAAVLVAVVTAAPAVLLGAVMVTAGTATLASCAWFAAAAAAFGALGAVVWLAGQRFAVRSTGAPRGWLLTGGLLALALLGAVVPGAGELLLTGPLARSWPGAGPVGPLWPLVGVALAAAALAVAPHLLDRLSGPAVLAQARRWEVAAVAVGAADVGGALSTFRAQPRVGRRWRAVTPRPPWLRFLVRDLVGAARTPARLAVGAVAVVAGGFVTALGTVPAGTTGPLPAGVPAPLAAAVGAVVGFAALGVVSDGFRHAADTAAHPPLYGVAPGRLVVLHAGLPVALGVLGSALGAGAAVLLGASAAVLPVTAATALLLVAVRASDSAKGPLPAVLLTPIPSPAGDVSGMLVLAWQADALLVVVVVTAAAAAPALVPATWSVAVLLGAALAMAGWCSQRLQRR